MASRRVSRWDDDDDDAGAHRGTSPPSRSASASATASRRVSRWDSQTRVTDRRRSSGRRKSGPQRNSDGDGREPSCTRRRRFRENISSDSEEEEAERGRNRNCRRLRLLSRDEEFDYLKDLEELDLHDSPPQAGPAINSKASAAAERHELVQKGGFHDAKVRAARERRWLVVNVRGSYDLASFQQTRAVWDADVMARCVRDRFVLWQAHAHAGGREGEEAQKVLCYYGLPRDRIPAVVVVDPVTGQVLEKLHGSGACELNDFLLRVGPYTDTKPAIPVRATKNSSVVPNQPAACRATEHRQLLLLRRVHPSMRNLPVSSSRRRRRPWWGTRPASSGSDCQMAGRSRRSSGASAPWLSSLRIAGQSSVPEQRRRRSRSG
ncbi:hypothetical protein BS78_02G125400 [Paspalum vaginatum]|nr:hypothetical protein BS78_02G125400 [Paspalum vaginatum]